MHSNGFWSITVASASQRWHSQTPPAAAAACRGFLGAHYIRWLLPTHYHLEEEGRGGPQRNILRRTLKGFCCFLFLSFCWGGSTLGYITDSCLSWCQFLTKDIFKNTVSVASTTHFVFMAIICSSQRYFPLGFDVSGTKNTFSFFFYGREKRLLSKNGKQWWTAVWQRHRYFLHNLNKRKEKHIYEWCQSAVPVTRSSSESRDSLGVTLVSSKKQKHGRQYAFSVAGPKVQLFVWLALQSSRQMVWPQGLIHYWLDYRPLLKRLWEDGRPEKSLEEPDGARKGLAEAVRNERVKSLRKCRVCEILIKKHKILRISSPDWLIVRPAQSQNNICHLGSPIEAVHGEILIKR